MPKKSKNVSRLTKEENEQVESIKRCADQLKLSIFNAMRDKRIPVLRQFWLAEEKLDECLMWAVKGVEVKSELKKRR